MPWCSECKSPQALKLLTDDTGEKKKKVKDSGKYLCCVAGVFLVNSLSASRNALDVRAAETYESCLCAELPLLFALSVKETQQLPLGKFHLNLILK